MPDSRGTPCLRVLLVETDEGDASRIRDLVAQMPECVEFDRAESFETALEAMTSGHHDAYLVAGRVADHSGIDLLRASQELGCDVPVLLLGDGADRGLDLSAMANGAAGFLAKDRLDAGLLERSIRYAVQARRLAAALGRAREELQERVEERSASLETMNAALAAEVAERRGAEQKLREGDRRKNDFLATLAHELRNPLAPIGHAMEILARLGGRDSDGTRAVEARRVIERQVSHLVRLIDDLLDVARISHGKVGLRRERVSLASIVQAALEATRPLFLDRRHPIEVVLPESPVTLDGDPVRLAQILSNLLSNAARYTSPSGTVKVVVAREQDAVVLQVIDSGIGIPPAVLPHIFTMFSQAAEARAVDRGGLGIGLALARQLTELHGGSLSAASEGAGKGSTFTLRLPVGTGPLASASPGTHEPGSDAVSAADVLPREGRMAQGARTVARRILVVDDNVDAARTLAELLSLEGYETNVASDGPAAVEMALRVRPSVAILDIGLPGFSGLEVARRLRSEKSLSGIVLVALSGWVQPEDLLRSSEAGFDQHFAKPVDVTVLLRLLAQTQDAAPAP